MNYGGQEDYPTMNEGTTTIGALGPLYNQQAPTSMAVTSEIRVTSDTGGQKGQKDVRLHAIPTEALFEVGKVFAFGEQKYDDYNFRKGYKWSLSFDALQRHAWAFWNREDRDKESALHHMAHAAWHCMVLIFYSLTERGEDDRPE